MNSSWLLSLALKISILFSPLTAEEFFHYITQNINAADAIHFQGEQYFSEQGDYIGPPGATISLFEINWFIPHNFNEKINANLADRKFCLLYQASTKSTKGALYFIESNLKKSCFEEWPRWDTVALTQISQFKINKQQQDKELFQFDLEITQGPSSPHQWPIKFHNVAGVEAKWERYSPRQTKRLVPGMMWWFSDTPLSLATEQTQNPQLIPSWRCKSFDEKGNLQKDDCQLCPWSPLPVANAKSLKKFSYECASERCGERGWPACVLGGGHLVDWDESDVCADPGEMAICRDGHAPQCNNHGDLYCP